MSSINISSIERCICCNSTNIRKNPAFFMPFIADRVFQLPQIKIDTATTGLRDIRAGYSYLPCNSMFCLDCNHLATDVRFNDFQMNLLYSGYRNEEYISLRNFYEPGYAERNRIFHNKYHYSSIVDNFILPNLPIQPKNILDWGGDTGINTPLNYSLINHHIYDISDVDTISGAQRVGHGDLSNFVYDLVVCQHVLEHLPFPKDDITKLLSLLRDPSYFYFEVPHEPLMRNDSIDKLSKIHWHEHINFFSLKSLSKLLESCGLDVLSIKSSDISNELFPNQSIIQCISIFNK